VAVFLSAIPGAAQENPIDFFEKRVRPVLAEHCYSCHSAGVAKPKGGLRLDSREGLLRGGSRGPAIVPGDASRSLLVQAVRRAHAEIAMPPEEKLAAAAVDALAAWVDAGAVDPRTEGAAAPAAKQGIDRDAARRHWAFRPPADPPLPRVRDAAWPRTPVDHFILQKLEEKGLEPSPPADRRTLIRRLSFDLIGLPPTSGETAAFEADPSPDAYERLVERLLASPRHGERWGRHWLDVARYADTKGYVYDRDERRFVHSHAYRDWVIRALNDDMPYDRFLLYQIAGDVPGSGGRKEDLAAVGFLTLGQRFLGVIHDIIDDRLDVVFRGTQALTVSCARCHDHKYDPITQRDYYALYGVMHGSSTERLVRLPAGGPEDPDFEKGLREREDALRKALDAKRAEVSERLRAKAADYLLAVLDVESLPSEEFYAFVGPDDINPVVARQWQAYLFQTRKAGREGEGHPVFAAWHALASLPASRFTAEAPRVIAALSAGPSGRAKSGADGPAALNPLVASALAAAPPASMRETAARYGEVFRAVHREWRDAVEAARKSGAPPPSALADLAAEEVRQVLHGPDSPASVPAGSVADIEWFFDEPTRVELAKLQSRIEAWIIDHPRAAPHAVVLEDRPALRNPRVFIRGNPARKGAEVERRFLEVLAGPAPPPFRNGSGRLDLARAIASPENPLTARVMVNRVWMLHFGRGLVGTPSDFGARSEPPTHPELLDFLARRFVEGGWSVKSLHRLIVLSSTYRQSSSERPEHARLDPENRLLGRMNRSRLDFESLRDSMLMASGELDLAAGGRGVNLFAKPFPPRRSVYGFIDRQFLPGVYRVFDVANPDQHSPERHATTVPQQALFLMNSPFVVERARALSRRPDLPPADAAADRIHALHRLVYQREPTAGEVHRALEFLASAPPVPAKPPAPPSPWKYGRGRIDEHAGRVEGFEALPHFTGEAWQGGEAWPDATFGWVRLTAAGGHAGNDLAHAAVRRWVSPIDGKVSVKGAVRHGHKAGDGVRAFIVSSRSGILASWVLHDRKAEAAIDPIEVEKGDTVDFVCDLRSNLNSDDFEWAPVIRGGDQEWNAAKDFAGPPPEPLDRWEQYAQALLLSNELAFVD
jgi:hypothetical protein